MRRGQYPGAAVLAEQLAACLGVEPDGGAGVHQVAGQGLQQRMLDGDPDAQPYRAGAGVGQESVLDDERSRGRSGCRSATCS